jgi:hypothetical protein
MGGDLGLGEGRFFAGPAEAGEHAAVGGGARAGGPRMARPNFSYQGVARQG